MSIGKVHSSKKVIAQLLLLAVPTAILLFYLLWDVNRFYDILENNWIKQGIYFSSGIFLSTIFYAFRFRFITTAAIVFLFCYSCYKLSASITFGEFDSFYFSVQFLIFSMLFCTGWLAGFGFSRSRYFTVIWSVLLLVIQIVVVSKTTDITVNALINAFVPILAYAFYIIYTSEMIRNMNEEEPSFIWFITKRLSGFALLVMLLFLIIFTLFKSDFTAIEKEWGGTQQRDEKGKDKSENMNKKDGKGNVSNKDQTKLTGSLSKDKQLVFVAKLDNYFDDNTTPNPLYFTAFYYGKFDTLTQTFEQDSLMPYNDLFSPNPSKIPLYFSKTDSSVLKNSFATRNRKVVTTDVYKVALSPDVFLAPSTAFSCQPMSVPKEFKDQYKSSYRAKMWVSDLNSAYFIYNPAGNRQLQAFQELRFEKLREIRKVTGPDKKFMSYYTFMPRDEEYKKIGELARRITADAPTQIDKMIAVRDYFLSKDEFDQPLFKYSDNPGIPGLPSANKLTYFLFENRKGYCAYFAGATLFMLRSLGIPSRVAAGYLTVDRSSKNPGWYWYYADQAHAWVQVYFPEYGWIDFDTTVPDVNTQQSPQPDGTPPMNIPQTYLVADGEIKSVDEKSKTIGMEINKLLYHDKDYETKMPQKLFIDVSIATISADTGSVALSSLKPGMHITAVSYSESLKDINAEANDSLASILNKLPVPTPVDEVKLLMKDQLKEQQKKKEEKAKEPIDWARTIITLLLILAALLVLVFLSPWFIWQFFNTRAKGKGSDKAYCSYSASLYYLNQLGFPRSLNGPQEFALNIDRHFGTNFNQFNNAYQKAKYSRLPLSADEKKVLHESYIAFIKKIKSQVPLKTRISRFLNIYNTIHFFQQPKIN
jgi:protein-glutamine gamma-glutamyltransferase